MMMISGAVIWIAAAVMYSFRAIDDAYIWPGIVGTVVVVLGVLKEFTEFKTKPPAIKDS